MNIGILGVGLMGGSFSLGIRSQKDVRIIGWDQNQDNLGTALKKGIIDQISDSFESFITESDIIIVAIPVSSIEKILPDLLDKIDSDKIVVDFGSTKFRIQEKIKSHPLRSRYIGAHPIAGTEYSGPEAAFEALYKGKIMIICNPEEIDYDALNTFESFCDSMDMQKRYMNSKEHDFHLAYVSHLSHITSFALSNTVLEKEKEKKNILDLAGSGFDSTVRLAKSDPEMWTSIFLSNSENILSGIDDYLAQINEIRDAILSDNPGLINTFLSNGREIRKILK